MLIIVQMERQLCSSGETCDLCFQPNKILISLKTIIIITLKLVHSTIRIFNQPHSTPSVPILYCSLWAHMKDFFQSMQYAHACVRPPLI